MGNYSRLVEIFETLVGFRTVTGDHDAATACLDHAETLFAEHGLHINRYSSNGFPSLIATTHKTTSPKLLLQAHIDVVPGDDALFQLQGEGTKLYGRGAFDMKYAAACYMRLVEEFGARLPEYDFGIMLTADEEQGGLNGVSYLLDQGFSTEVCVLPDGGDNWRVETAAKGGWIVEVVAKGKTAHGSRPWDGDNAIVKLMGFLQAAMKLAPDGRAHTATTIVVSMLTAGLAENQVPDEARARLDIRYLDMAAYQKISSQLGKLMQKHDIAIASDRLIHPVELDPTLPAVQQWLSIASEIRGADSPNGYALSFGASDARFFASKGIPTIVTRPDGGGMHSDDEWIDEVGLYQFYDCLKRYVEHMAII